MGVRKDLKQAKQRGGLADRVTVEVMRDDHGVVREARTPAMTPRPETGSMADLPFINATEAPTTVVLRRKESGTWRPVSAAEFAQEVTATATGLIAAGLEPGARVAVMSRTR